MKSMDGARFVMSTTFVLPPRADLAGLVDESVTRPLLLLEFRVEAMPPTLDADAYHRLRFQWLQGELSIRHKLPAIDGSSDKELSAVFLPLLEENFLQGNPLQVHLLATELALEVEAMLASHIHVLFSFPESGKFATADLYHAYRERMEELESTCTLQVTDEGVENQGWLRASPASFL